MAVDQRSFRALVRVGDYEDVRYKEAYFNRILEDIRELDRDFEFLFQNLIIGDEQKGETIDAIYEQFNQLKENNFQLMNHLENESCPEVVRQLHYQVNNKLTIQSMIVTYTELITS